MSSEGSNASGPARRGRPRKWASEAERKRAYRARKADELADPARLRVDLRDSRNEVHRLEGECARLERVVRQAERKVAREAIRREDLEAEIGRRDDVIAFWQHRARTAEDQLWQIRHPGRDGE